MPSLLWSSWNSSNVRKTNVGSACPSLKTLTTYICQKHRKKRDSMSNVTELTLCDCILTINSSNYGHLSPAHISQ